MSSKATKTNKASKSTYVHTPRVASFTVKQSKGEKIFTPVNKRACKMARKLGKRTRLTEKDLRQFKDYHKLMSYTKSGALKTIAL